jgi:hypothetical protein
VSSTITVSNVEEDEVKSEVIIAPLDLKFATVANPEIFTSPLTSKAALGDSDRIPTLLFVGLYVN